MRAINVLGLAKRVNAKVLQASTSEVYGDPKQRQPNIELANEMFDVWKQKTQLKEGLALTIKYFTNTI